MATHLEEILAVTRRDVALRKQSADLAALEKHASAHIPRGFAAALRRHSATQPAIIAELKKASPSRGLIRADFQVASLATGLANAGAAALSVLTEEHFFQGSLANLQQASQSVRIPCLRKDFIVDEFQILEARAASADAILLIAAALDDAALKYLTRAAHAQQLDVLCEVHDAEELARVLDLGCDAIGVNNRNLRTFEVRLETSLELAQSLPSAAVRVTESGIHTAADIARLRAAGFHAFLVGESLMRQPDPAQALTNLLAAMWIKICGITSLEDAQLAVHAGADAIGFVFATSPRQMTPKVAREITKELPSSIEKIGVFVDASTEEIIAACETAGLSGVQLHGEYPADQASDLHMRLKKISAQLRVVQVVHYDGDAHSFAQRLRDLKAQSAADATLNAVLVDTRMVGKLGGTGVSFDWRSAQDSFRRQSNLRLIAAGGLHPENIREAIQTLHPWGVDVSSGVESVPGRKDRQRVMEFIRAARAAATEFAEAAQR